MALNDSLLSRLVDPIDRGTLRYVAQRNVLYNPRRRRIYEVRDDIAVLLDHEARDATEVEHDELMADPSGRDTQS